MRIVTRTAVATLLAVPSTIQAADILVPADQGTIQAAINASAISIANLGASMFKRFMRVST